MSSDRFRALRQKLDDKVEQLSLRHKTHMQCRKGCHSCCQPGLSVFPVEAREIRNFILEQGLRDQLLQLEASNPFEGHRCHFLQADGACSIYAVRPLICRSHGLPLLYRDEQDEVNRDVCPLNFQESSLADLAGDGILNLDLINTLLTLINQEAMGEQAGIRVALKPSALLGEGR